MARATVSRVITGPPHRLSEYVFTFDGFEDQGRSLLQSLLDLGSQPSLRSTLNLEHERPHRPFSRPVLAGALALGLFSPVAIGVFRQIHDDDLILDIGPQTAHIVAALMKEAKTIIWNGPLGVFEFDQFGEGTKEMAEAIADSDAFSIAGGGDTLAAVDKYGITDRISYISTGGGAFLEFVEGKVLPAVAMLEARAKD